MSANFMTMLWIYQIFQNIIDKNYKIEKISTTKSNAIKIFEEHGMYEKAELLRPELSI